MMTFFLGCNKKEIEEITPVFTKFTLKSELNNKILSSDLSGRIKNDTIYLDFPRNMNLNNLIPSFETNAKKITVNSVEQISGKSKINLSFGIIYTLTSETNNQKRYSVKINYIDEGTYFSKFLIEKKNNPSLKKDIITTTSNDTIYGVTSSRETFYIPTFTTKAKEVWCNGKKQQSGVSKIDFSKPVTYKFISPKGFLKTCIAVIKQEISIPQMYITTEGNKPITSKKEYLKASIKIDGNGTFDDYEGKGKIKGRGNSTWGMPKKPYKIKLSKKTGLLGMLPEKDWVLLANYLDPTFMLTATAMKIGEKLEIDYINHIIPIDVTINGTYQGQYNLTEKIEVKTNRVNVKGGVLLEMDTNYDEDYKFKTDTYRLPIMFKYPKKVKESLLTKTKKEFNELAKLVASSTFPNNNYSDYFDKEAFAKYIIVYLLTDNEEINHPKSIYIHKKEDGKYKMGPIWDFDWAYGYEGTQKHFSTYSRSLFWTGSKKKSGTLFFERILSDPEVSSLVKEKWEDYRANHFEDLLSYLETYYKSQKESRKKDYSVWKTGTGNFDREYKNLIKWLKNRADYLDTYIKNL